MDLDFELVKILGKSVEDVKKNNDLPGFFNLIEKFEIDIHDYRLINKKKGMSLAISNPNTIYEIFLYSGSEDGYSMYSSDLPYNINFSDSAQEAKEKIPLKDYTYVKPIESPLFGFLGANYIYYYDNCFLNMRFIRNESAIKHMIIGIEDPKFAGIEIEEDASDFPKKWWQFWK